MRDAARWLSLLAFVGMTDLAAPTVALGGVALGLKVPAGFEISVFADEKLANDTYAMTLDAKGRVVVTTRGEVKTLHDDDGDGRADRATTFARTDTGGMGLCFDGNDLLFCGDGWLSRYRDKDGDGRADGPPERILPLAFTEHGGHAIRKGPDGWWYVIGGNDSKIGPEHATLKDSPVKQPEAGAILRLPPDLKGSEIFAHGFRNPYDFDFNLLGDIFTYDSDVERDVFLPWYFPTRVYHVTEGGHHGWRVTGFQRSWPRPTYDPGTVGVLDWVGRGSPTGVAAYRHNAFPAIYQDGLFILDWTFGKVFFLQLVHHGLGVDHSGYVAHREVFLEPTGTSGFAPTDVAVAPDGSLLISIGGRRTRGSVYRVTYTGTAQREFGPTPRNLAPIDVVLGAPQPLDAWSRARWEPSADKLGRDAFRAAALDEKRQTRDRLRAVEILTERFGGLDADMAHRLAKSDSSFVRERTAWSLGRVKIAGTMEVLHSLTHEPTARIRLAALNALGNHVESLDKETVASTLVPNLNFDDKRTRDAAVHLASRITGSSWEVLKEALKTAPVQARISGLLAELLRGPRDALRADLAERILDLLDDDPESADLRIQLLRLLQRSLGDWCLRNPSVEVLTAYSTRVPLGDYPEVARRIREILPGILASKTGPTIEDEAARVLAMVEDADPRVLRSAAGFWTDRSSPTRDLHYLIVCSRLKAARDAGTTRQVSRAIVALDRKLSGQEQRIKQSWNARLGETVKLLLDRDPNLGDALVDEPGFVVPNHAALALSLEPKARTRAAGHFLKAVKGNEDYAWSSSLIELLATLPAEQVLPVFRMQWPNFALRDALLPRLASHPDEADRARFLDALDSSLPETIQTALGALEALPRDATPVHLVPPLRLLRRLTLEPKERTLRGRVLALIGKQGGETFSVTDDKDDIKAVRQAYEPVFDWFQRSHPALAGQVLATGENLAAWTKRVAAIDWARGNEGRGAKVFAERGCQTCHAGSRALGPDLTGATSRLSRADLFTAIVAPSLDVSPLYRTTIVETRDGQVFGGMIAFESADGLIIQTGATTTVRVDNSEITSRHVGNRSLMPDELLRDLKDADLADLDAYLRSLSNKASTR